MQELVVTVGIPLNRTGSSNVGGWLSVILFQWFVVDGLEFLSAYRQTLCCGLLLIIHYLSVLQYRYSTTPASLACCPPWWWHHTRFLHHSLTFASANTNILERQLCSRTLSIAVNVSRSTSNSAEIQVTWQASDLGLRAGKKNCIVWDNNQMDQQPHGPTQQPNEFHHPLLVNDCFQIQ